MLLKTIARCVALAIAVFYAVKGIDRHQEKNFMETVYCYLNVFMYMFWYFILTL